MIPSMVSACAKTVLLAMDALNVRTDFFRVLLSSLLIRVCKEPMGTGMQVPVSLPWLPMQ